MTVKNQTQELVTILAACDESKGQIKPKRAGYFRIHVEDDGDLFLSVTPLDLEVTPITKKIDMDMTIREAIEVLGRDGQQILEWLFDVEPDSKELDPR